MNRRQAIKTMSAALVSPLAVTAADPLSGYVSKGTIWTTTGVYEVFEKEELAHFSLCHPETFDICRPDYPFKVTKRMRKDCNGKLEELPVIIHSIKGYDVEELLDTEKYVRMNFTT